LDAIRAFRTFILIYPVSISERLSTSIKLNIQVPGRHLPFEIAAPTEQGSSHHC